MSEPAECLGLCFTDDRLFYAVNDPDEQSGLKHIGSIEFSFPVLKALTDPEGEPFTAVSRAVEKLRHNHPVRQARILTPALMECWSTLPRLVYETADEREDHLKLLMQGSSARQDLEATWFGLSNQEQKLLLLRNRSSFDGIRKLLLPFPETDQVSEFELGREWQSLTGTSGSWMNIHCHEDHLSISSYLLGKLRGATWSRYDSLADLPYLWSFYSRQLQWMNGIHEQVYIYGEAGLEVLEVMEPAFAETGEAILMNSLDRMKVSAEESTYGFRLECAFPAILLSLNDTGSEDRNPNQS
ncbi:MAG: hypothetical protein WD094_02375 [Balneolaceae bacterium]